MSKIFEKPTVTVSGKKCLFKSSLHQRLVQDLPQEGVDWRRRLDSTSKLVYIDVDFVDFDVDSVERASERLSRCSLAGSPDGADSAASGKCSQANEPAGSVLSAAGGSPAAQAEASEHTRMTASPAEGPQVRETITEYHDITIEPDDDRELQIRPIVARSLSPGSNSGRPSPQPPTEQPPPPSPQQQRPANHCDASDAFFNQKLLGRPILHTYWADKADFEAENQKSQFDEWIGKVQASTCTEWAIIIIEEGDFKAQLGTALFKSKLQSSASQSNVSSSSTTSLSNAMSQSSSSFLDRMKKGLSTMFQNDSNSDRWLGLVNQNRLPDTKAQESYAGFVKKLRNLIIVSFSKQIELFEEQLRVQRELRAAKNWSFSSYFSMQEELAFAFEFLTLFDEALVQYDFLDALFTEYISSPQHLSKNTQAIDSLYNRWGSFKSWPGLCLDMNCKHSELLRQRIVNREASLLDFRNYLFAKRCDLMFMQNQPWRVAASTSAFLQNCIREHRLLQIETYPGALICWSFTSALEVLQKCECYSCTSTMENYSLHTVDIWNTARVKLIELGNLVNRMPGSSPFLDNIHQAHIDKLIAGIGQDPHNGVSYQKNDISPQARLRDALASEARFAKHLIEISELTLGTYKHIGRKRHANLVGKELAEFYVAQQKCSRALPFLIDMERALVADNWPLLVADIRAGIAQCSEASNALQQAERALHANGSLSESSTGPSNGRGEGPSSPTRSPEISLG